jgi:CubicO group peptidase (beta-lactamase class C family)
LAVRSAKISGVLTVEIDPQEAGFDAQRLARIDRHFQRYVDDRKLPGFLFVLAHDGRIVHTASGGLRDIAQEAPVEHDTIWRIYSMTKPITSVAAMLLYEEGAFELKDPIATFLPEFATPRVWRNGSPAKPITVPATEPIRVWHLLTHTAGLTYGFHYAHPLDAMYRAAGFEWGSPPGLDLAGCVEVWAGLPLLFEPGTEWNYGVSTDVLGRLVEVVSGQSLDVFLQERIFAPLGMVDTAFAPTDTTRLAELYQPGLERIAGSEHPMPFLSGGGGLYSTAADYLRFTTMLLNDGAPLLSSRTARYMRQNHLPGGVELEQFARPVGAFAETQFAGHGFGLGFSVLENPTEVKILSSKGEIAWGGAASTAFWVDPAERITAHFFTQLLPSSTYPLRGQMRQLVYQALR